MAYTGKTSNEINLFHIEKTLTKLENREITVKESGLNKRFEKLKAFETKNKHLLMPWHDELYSRYIETVKKLNNN